MGSLTSEMMIDYRWYILRWKLVGCVGDQKTGFSHCKKKMISQFRHHIQNFTEIIGVVI